MDKVILPLLNCVKKCNQNGLTQIPPVLYKDLSEGKLKTLNEYKVQWTYIQIYKQFSSTELEKYLLLEMCKKVAEVVGVQCGQEYIPEDEQDPRAVQLYAMTDEGRKNIPTENLVTERSLAKFGYLASLSASRSNKNFKTKQIQDDLILSSVEIDVKVLKKTESIIKDLQSMEVM